MQNSESKILRPSYLLKNRFWLRPASPEKRKWNPQLIHLEEMIQWISWKLFFCRSRLKSECSCVFTVTWVEQPIVHAPVGVLPQIRSSKVDFPTPVGPTTNIRTDSLFVESIHSSRNSLADFNFIMFIKGQSVFWLLNLTYTDHISLHTALQVPRFN